MIDYVRHCDTLLMLWKVWAIAMYNQRTALVAVSSVRWRLAQKSISAFAAMWITCALFGKCSCFKLK